MNSPLYTMDLSHLNHATPETIECTVSALESGQIIYCPHDPFQLQENENDLLTESILRPKHKNISYQYSKKQLSGVNPSALPDALARTASLMHRFADYAHTLIMTLCPHYTDALLWGRTSYRPAEIKDRKISKRKDDTRLHVDAFPATPVQGLRILRVFCNINPHEQPRVWNVGEPFHQVLQQFASQLPPYSRLMARCLQWVKATKSLRSPYDHFMLHLHDQMKSNDDYQQTVKKHRVDFKAQTTWIVFTDVVSHAALSGQYLLEQTFYLPVSAMQDPERSPLKQWEALA